MKSLSIIFILGLGAFAQAERYGDNGMSRYYAEQARQRSAEQAEMSRYYAEQARERSAQRAEMSRYYAEQARERSAQRAETSRFYAEQARARSSSNYGGSSYRPSYSPGYSSSYSDGWREVPSQEWSGDGWSSDGWSEYSPQVVYPQEYVQPQRQYVQPQQQNVQPQRQYVQPQQQNVIVLKTSTIALELPKGASVKVDGNSVSTNDDVLRMSFEGMRPDKEKKIQIEVVVREDGFEKSSTYDMKLQYNADHKGKINFHPQSTRDYYLEELKTKSKGQEANLTAWHSEYGKLMETRTAESERWRDGMLKQLEREPEAIRTEMTAEVKEKVATSQALLDELTKLFSEEYSARQKGYAEAIAAAIAAREKGGTMVDVKRDWDAAMAAIDARDFKKRSDAVLAEEQKWRQQYLFASSLEKRRSIQAYLTGTLAKWLSDAVKKTEDSRVAMQKKLVEPLRQDLATWEKSETTRIATVDDKVIHEIVEKAYLAEQARRMKVIADLESAIVTEMEARKAAHLRVHGAFEQEYRETQAIKTSMETQKKIDAVELERKSQAETVLEQVASSEKTARTNYVPAATTIETELVIRKYRLDKTAEFLKSANGVREWANQLRGSRFEDLAAWHAGEAAELKKIPHRPVVMTVNQLLEGEYVQRQAFETARKKSVDELEEIRLSALDKHLTEFISEYRANRVDTAAATHYRGSLASLVEKVDALESRLADALKAEEERRAKFAGVVALAKAETARYPLALKLPTKAASYFLGSELDETIGLYSVDANGKHTRIAWFDAGTLVDAVATDDKLLLLSRGAKSLDATPKLGESSNAEIASFTSNRGTSVFLFDKDTLVLVQKPDLANSVFERVWVDTEGGGFFVNIVKAEKRFTMQVGAAGDEVDIVETKEAPAADASLFQRVEK